MELLSEEIRERSCFNQERWNVLFQALAEMPAEGSLVEIGVHRGGVSAFLALRYPDRDVYGYDAFERGLVGVSPEDRLEEGILATPLADVTAWLAKVGATNVHLVPGDIRDTLPDRNDVAPIALAIVDLNLHLPTLHALRWLDYNMALGGIVLVDDKAFPGVAMAIHDFHWDGWTVEDAGYMVKATLGRAKGLAA